MIKHEEVIKAFKELILELDLSIGEVLEVEDDNLSVIYKFITEQEKKDELLELYRKLHDTYRYPTWKNEKDVQCVLKQIKALEEEMK